MALQQLIYYGLIQGHELAILQAAPHMINHIKVIFAEVSFIESYEGQPLYNDVVAWMIEHGFEQVGRDFEDEPKSFFGNALFVKNKYEKNKKI